MIQDKPTFAATYSLKLIFLLPFEFERRIKDSNFQVDALLEASSAKTKARNLAAVGHLNGTLKFMRQFEDFQRTPRKRTSRSSK